MGLSTKNIGVGAHIQPQLLLRRSDQLRHSAVTCFTHRLILRLPCFIYVICFSSRARALHQSHDIDTLMLPEFTGPLVPMDWIFLPLLHLYVEAQKA